MWYMSLLHRVLRNDHSVRLRRLKTYLRNTMEQQRASNIALISIESACANSVDNNDMDRIIDIFGRRRNDRDSFRYFFLSVLLAHMIDSYVGQS